MKTKTKIINTVSIIGIIITTITLLGCQKIALPQPPVPTLFAETETTKPIELVVKHISLFKQGITFDILDNNESRDATGVIIERNSIKVMDDIMIIEKKSKKESIEKFLDNINQGARNCYTIEKGSENSRYDRYLLKINSSCDYEEKKGLNQIMYIYNNDIPDMVIKIEQSEKNNSPRADLEGSKIRYESIQFL